MVLEYGYIKVLLGKSWLNWTRSCQINAYKEVRFVHLMIIMYHKCMYRFNWIIIPWYITFITKQNQQSLVLELLKLCSIVYLVMYKYGFPSCSIIYFSLQYLNVLMNLIHQVFIITWSGHSYMYFDIIILHYCKYTIT